MKILVIGGTRFVGWHLVAECLARGHHVTLLNRGRTGPAQWAELPKITTNRRAPKGLSGHGWDHVIDCCVYEPEDLAVIELLQRRTAHYTLISSASVHDLELGRAKRECEEHAARVLGDTPLLIPRLGLTIGPRDPTGRLAYWLGRARRGGPVLVPMKRDQPLRLLDVRDMAACVLDAAIGGGTGSLDVIGPATTAGDVLDLVACLTGGGTHWVWVPEDAALANGLRPWTQIPLWIPVSDARGRRLMSRIPAETPQLLCRPLTETLRDLLAIETPTATSAEWLDEQAERHLITRLCECETV